MRYLIFLACLSLLGCETPYEKVDRKDKIKVALQPYKGFPEKRLPQLQEKIETYYGVSTMVLKSKAIPQRFYVTVKTPRYRADSIIKELKRTLPDSIHYIVGLTNKDISTTKRNDLGMIKSPEHKYTDWGIFGLGYRPGPSCVVSTHRIKGTSNAHTFERLQKIVLHELGHNFGLPHCPNESCFMRDAAEKISTIDHVKMNLCASCKKRINLPEE